MSSTSVSAPPAALPLDLPALRAELDRIDDAIHDLLMERAQVVARLAESGAKGRVALRAGREAQIVRRLLARHRPPLPRAAVFRIWRELFAATTSMQGGHAVAVCEGDPAGAYTQLSREHFGALTPMRAYHGPAQTLADLRAGAVSVAVLPMPSEAESRQTAWWTNLLAQDEPRIHVVARLPFWSPRPDGAPRVEALVISTVPPDPTGADRSLLGLELGRDVSRARLTADLAAANLTLLGMILRREPGTDVAQALLEIDGHVAEDDRRLDALTGLLRRPAVLGGYAVPVE